MTETNGAHSPAGREPLWPRVLFLLGLLAALAGTSVAITKPLTQDEADPFCISGAAIAAGGPSVLGERVEGSRFPGGTRYEIPHPALYNLAVAGAFRIAGVSSLSARGLGLVFHLCSLYLIAMIALRAGLGRAVALAACGLYMALPLAIQYPLFIDIDNSLLTPLLLALMLLALSHFDAPSPAGLVVIAVWLALSLWCKETTPYIALAAIALWWMLRGRRVDGLWRWAAVGLLGTALFAGTWWLFCLVTGVPVDAFFQFTIQQKLLNEGEGASFGPGLARLWNEGNWIAVWLTPAFLLAGAIAVIDRIVRLWRSRRAEPIDLFMIFAVLLFAVHGVYYPGLKYIFPLVAPLALLLADFLVRGIGRVSLREGLVAGAAVAAISLLVYFFVRDPILPGSSLKRVAFYATFLPLAGTAAVLVPLGGLRRGLLMALAVTVLGGALQQDLRHLKPASAVPSYGDYGETGAKEMIALADSRLPDECRFIARIDFGFGLREAAGKPGRERVVVGFFRNERTIPREKLIETLDDPKLRGIILDSLPDHSSRAGERDTARSVAYERGFVETARFGNFTLLERASGAAGSAGADSPETFRPSSGGEDAGVPEAASPSSGAEGAAAEGVTTSSRGGSGFSSGSRSDSVPL